ncbi:MAG TPA: hypothetical protein PKJ24_07500 [Prolixibacteraceae bacterium]|nr:hypothetical protein [Prolixibacteraceae bacterium]
MKHLSIILLLIAMVVGWNPAVPQTTEIPTAPPGPVPRINGPLVVLLKIYR